MYTCIYNIIYIYTSMIVYHILNIPPSHHPTHLSTQNDVIISQHDEI